MRITGILPLESRTSEKHIVILLWSQGLRKRSRAQRPKNVHFLGTSRKDLKALPEGARAVFGYAILLAEHGMKHPVAKPLKGFGGAGVLEVVEDLDGDAYRAVYAVKFDDRARHPTRVQEEVQSRLQDLRPEIRSSITKRFKEAEEHDKENHAPKKK